MLTSSGAWASVCYFNSWQIGEIDKNLNRCDAFYDSDVTLRCKIAVMQLNVTWTVNNEKIKWRRLLGRDGMRFLRFQVETRGSLCVDRFHISE